MSVALTDRINRRRGQVASAVPVTALSSRSGTSSLAPRHVKSPDTIICRDNWQLGWGTV